MAVTMSSQALAPTHFGRAAPRTFRTKYSSSPVIIPAFFLAPLAQSATPSRGGEGFGFQEGNASVRTIDFANVTGMEEYEHFYAAVIDGLFTREECDQLIAMAECSAVGNENGFGAIFTELRNGKKVEEKLTLGPASPIMRSRDMSLDEMIDPKGWHRALVRSGLNRETLHLNQRNSHRIIWSQQEIATRIFNRIMQIESVREDLKSVSGERCKAVMGDAAFKRRERWKLTTRGLNESLKFLRYGPGQYFKEHCDGTHETPEGDQRSFYTIHLYLNDSKAALELSDHGAATSASDMSHESHLETEILEGGPTTFHSSDLRHKISVDCKVGRVLIFQQRGLLHSGDEVTRGIKYTMRSDVMYEFDDDGDGLEEAEDGGDIMFE